MLVLCTYSHVSAGFAITILYALSAAPMPCQNLLAPANGMVSVTGLMSGDTATYTCDSGYELVGDTTRTCDLESAGMWSGSAPACVGMNSLQ